MSPEGYLHDLDLYGNEDINGLATFQRISRFRCLILLGEPGMGKTHAMQGALSDDVRNDGAKVGRRVHLDLRSYGSEDRLMRDLFYGQDIQQWKNGIGELHLFLDSLDECLLRIDTLAALLLDEIKKCPTGRLFLRITCRTAEWPNLLESGLKELWDEREVAAYELAPLRRKDVGEAARENGLDATTFLEQIETSGVVPFAIKPVTLEFLIRLYKKQGRLALTQAELYEQGCRFLCEEPNDNRRETRLRPAFPIDHRMAVAARIAAITSLSNRYAVWTGRDRGTDINDDVSVPQLCGGKERAGDQEFDVDEESIGEAIATGLFSSRGPSRMGWAHQTYAEFLAARYLIVRELPFNQLKMLLSHPGDPQGQIIPQLQEIAAWLAEMSPEMFDYLVVNEPELLLRSPVSTANPTSRSRLVNALLSSCEKEVFHPRQTASKVRYKKLAHSALSLQLRPYLVDKSRSVLARDLAIDIAEECDARDLQAELLTIALDQEEEILLRAGAAYALHKIGDKSTNNKLLPLALGQAGDDPEDQLKGCGLRSVWPGGMRATEMFAHLTVPKRSNFVGAYKHFLSSELIEGLTPADLMPALKWVAKVKLPDRELGDDLEDAFDGLIGQIMKKAWEYLDTPGVTEAFGLAALSRLQRYESVFGGRYEYYKEGLLSGDDSKRRKVLVALWPHLAKSSTDLACLRFTGDSLIQEGDFNWLIEKFARESAEDIQQVLVRLIHFAFDRSDRNQFEAVYSLAETSPLLAKEFAWLLKPVVLGSPEAQEAKKIHEQLRDISEKTKKPLLEPPPTERVRKLLDELECGEASAWWRLNMELTLKPTSTHYGDELEPDITAFPGWVAADAETRRRIVSAAKKYLQIQDPNVPHWLGTNIVHRPAFAGYRALRLLAMTDPESCSAIHTDVWQKWAPIILAYPISGAESKLQISQDLVKFAHRYSPEAVIETLLVLIDAENKNMGSLFITRKMEECWNDQLCSVLADKLRDQNLTPRSVAELLTDLVVRDVAEARSFAEELLACPIELSGDSREKAIVAARVLFTKAKDSGWAVIWPILQNDVTFGMEVVSTLEPYSDKSPSWAHLKEESLANLYIWLVHQFPHSTDPNPTGAHWVGPNDRARGLRDGVLNVLKMKGTFEACDAIRRIRGELPELDWLKWVQADAELQARRESWIPPQPQQLLAVFKDSQNRIVQNAEHLLQVVKESLNRLQEQLHGETPSVQFLWDRTSQSKTKPKDESALSDFVKLHLEKDLKARQIIVNREVQIHRKEKTDIHVDTFVMRADTQQLDMISVIIEVKGSWNRELETAMKTQLKDRYLQNSHCQHGLYLVGWFNCDQWDEKDYRKTGAPKQSLHEAQQRFDAQAKDLSGDGLHIETLVLDTSFV